jgi:hypothetical protein
MEKTAGEAKGACTNDGVEASVDSNVGQVAMGALCVEPVCNAEMAVGVELRA